jgi:hypothetical protein
MILLEIEIRKVFDLLICMKLYKKSSTFTSEILDPNAQINIIMRDLIDIGPNYITIPSKKIKNNCVAVYTCNSTHVDNYWANLNRLFSYIKTDLYPNSVYTNTILINHLIIKD